MNSVPSCAHKASNRAAAIFVDKWFNQLFQLSVLLAASSVFVNVSVLHILTEDHNIEETERTFYYYCDAVALFKCSGCTY